MTPAAPSVWRLLPGLAAVGLSVLPVHRGGVGRVETAVFRRLNELPDGLRPPLWAVMQTGALGAVPVAAGLAAWSGRRRLAVRLAASGGGAYYLAKGIKALVRRGRPGDLIERVRIRGNPAGGHGYLSGHAAVSSALAAAAFAELGRPYGRLAVAGVPVVAVARMYVGAHLPLDVLGGVAFGWTVDTGVAALLTAGD